MNKSIGRSSTDGSGYYEWKRNLANLSGSGLTHSVARLNNILTEHGDDVITRLIVGFRRQNERKFYYFHITVYSNTLRDHNTFYVHLHNNRPELIPIAFALQPINNNHRWEEIDLPDDDITLHTFMTRNRRAFTNNKEYLLDRLTVNGFSNQSGIQALFSDNAPVYTADVGDIPTGYPIWHQNMGSPLTQVSDDNDLIVQNLDFAGSGYSDWIANLNAIGSGNTFSGNRVQPVTINIRPYRTILDKYGGYRIDNILLYRSELGRYYIQLFIRNLRNRYRPVYIRLEKSGQTGVTVSESISQSDDYNVLHIDNSNDLTVEEFINNVGDTSSYNSYTYIVNLLSNNGYLQERVKRFMRYDDPRLNRRPQYSVADDIITTQGTRVIDRQTRQDEYE